jgi:hypothetical protein
MPRPLKPHFIEKVFHKNGRDHLDVMFDRDHKVFFVATGQVRKEHSDLAEVRKLAAELLKQPPTYEWRPVIVVDHQEPEEKGYRYWADRGKANKHYASTVFEFYRAEICPDPRRKGEQLVRSHTVEWDEQVAEWQEAFKKGRSGYNPEQRIRERAENTGNIDRFGAGDSDRVLPYSEDLWQGLLAIESMMKLMRRRLSYLVEHPELEEVLRKAANAPPQLTGIPHLSRRLMKKAGEGD